MNDYLEISVTDWGLTFSTAPLYFNLQWWLIITALGVMIARKIMLNSKAKRLWQQAIDDEKAGIMSDSDYLLVLAPNELDTIRTALRAESDRCKRQGFEGLKTHTDNLRDKISNMMIEHTYTRLEGKSKV
jgi:hypothetical protein